MASILGVDELYFVDLDDVDENGLEYELKPGGRSIKVTEDNKGEYVSLLAEQVSPFFALLRPSGPHFDHV